MLSVADIPFLGFHFTGIIGVVLIDGKEYRIVTYLGAKIKQVDKNTVTVKQALNLNTIKLYTKTTDDLSVVLSVNELINVFVHFLF